MPPIFRPTVSDGGATAPRPVELSQFLEDIREQTGESAAIVAAVFNGLVDRGDIHCERDPENPTRFVVFPSPTLARFAGPAARTTTGSR